MTRLGGSAEGHCSSRTMSNGKERAKATQRGTSGRKAGMNTVVCIRVGRIAAKATSDSASGGAEYTV